MALLYSPALGPPPEWNSQGCWRMALRYLRYLRYLRLYLRIHLRMYLRIHAAASPPLPVPARSGTCKKIREQLNDIMRQYHVNSQQHASTTHVRYKLVRYRKYSVIFRENSVKIREVSVNFTSSRSSNTQTFGKSLQLAYAEPSGRR
jgi:hypothetical protein